MSDSHEVLRHRNREGFSGAANRLRKFAKPEFIIAVLGTIGVLTVASIRNGGENFSSQVAPIVDTLRGLRGSNILDGGVGGPPSIVSPSDSPRPDLVKGGPARSESVDPNPFRGSSSKPQKGGIPSPQGPFSSTDTGAGGQFPEN